MPRKGMRSVFFRSQTTLMPSSGPSSPVRTPRAPLYSFSEAMMGDTFKAAENIIQKWNPENSMLAKVSYLFLDNRKDAKEFIKCVKDLQRAMNYLLAENPNSEKLIRAQNLMQLAMRRLEKEFYMILSTNRDHLDPESISGRTSMRSSRRASMSRTSFSDLEDGVASSEDDIQAVENSISKVEEEAQLAIEDIRLIADCMISSGYGKECVKIYKILRKSIVDEGLYRLGIIHIKSSNIRKMDWEVLEITIKNWLNAVKIAVRTLFHGERILCDHVFANSSVIRESCFSEIAKEGAIILFGFPKKVAKSKRPLPDRVFRILDMYNALVEVFPEVESTFVFESTASVRARVISSLTRLGDATRSMITEFESSIHKDSSKLHIHGGAVHPLTKYVMTYSCNLSDYSVALSDIFANWSLPIQSPLPESYMDSLQSDNTPLSSTTVRFAWLILVLICKIDMKVELYKDVALSYLFLANNIHFIVTKVRESNLRFILGEDWILRHEMTVKQYISNYEKVGWSRVLSVIPDNPTEEVPLDEVKFRFKRFNSAFEDTYRTQSSWVVSDSKLRDDIEVSICKKLVSAYTQFYEKYRDVMKDSNIKFTPDELMDHISGMFYDTRVSIPSLASENGES